MHEVQRQEYFLKPGYMILPSGPIIIYLVLGSAVSVVLYDRETGKAGLCHFGIPRRRRNSPSQPKYGTVAVPGLIMMLEDSGCELHDIEAQVVGGSDQPGHTMGSENAEVAIGILRKKSVQITSSDVGGNKGRKVIYNPETNHLAVVKVEKIRSDDWYPFGVVP